MAGKKLLISAVSLALLSGAYLATPVAAQQMAPPPPPYGAPPPPPNMPPPPPPPGYAPAPQQQYAPPPQQQDSPTEGMTPQTQNGVTFVSGGVASEGREQIRAVEGSYNLRLMFAVQGSGEFLSDVHVRLTDSRGRTLVDTTADGPYFLAHVGPGRYQIAVDSYGRTQTRSVDVSGRASSLSFYWQPSR